MQDIKDLTRSDYEQIARLVYAQSGINLGDQKMQLVRARLGKRVRQGGFRSFSEYYHHVESDPSGEELCALLDAISTNTTHLFREIRHFHFLHRAIEEWVTDSSWRRNHPTLRIWSAGCSSGEEPYSIVMTAHDALQRHSGVDLKILATDISLKVLARAKLGIFESHRIGTVPPEYRRRYFARTTHEEQECVQVLPDLRQMIHFARFNLMTPSFPFRQGFDVIFCRNVMIYFDRQTQQTLVNKYADHLHKGGYLLIGHSESLNGLDHKLDYVEPTIYRKV